MKRLFKCHWSATIVLVGLLVTIAMPAAAAEITIVGNVNDNYQIVTPGKIYEIDDNPKGCELAENHVGSKVRVTGTVVESDDMKIFTVLSYKVLSD